MTAMDRRGFLMGAGDSAADACWDRRWSCANRVSRWQPFPRRWESRRPCSRTRTTKLVGMVEDAPEVRARYESKGVRMMALDDMLGDPSIDAIAVESPVRDHIRHASMVVDAGKHVHIEETSGDRRGVIAVSARCRTAQEARRADGLHVAPPSGHQSYAGSSQARLAGEGLPGAGHHPQEAFRFPTCGVGPSFAVVRCSNSAGMWLIR